MCGCSVQVTYNVIRATHAMRLYSISLGFMWPVIESPSRSDIPYLACLLTDDTLLIEQTHVPVVVISLLLFTLAVHFYCVVKVMWGNWFRFSYGSPPMW